LQKFRGEHASFLLVVLVLAAAWSAVAWQIAADYRATRHAGVQHMIASTAALEARMRLVVDNGIATAVAAARDIRALGDLGTLDVTTITATLRRKLAGDNAIHALWLATRERFACAGRDGQRVSGTIPRWQARLLGNHAAQFRIGRPAPAPFDHSEAVIAVAHRLPAAGRQPLWAGALLEVRGLENMLAKGLPAAESAALVSSDGTLLVSLHRAPDDSDDIGPQDTPTFRKIAGAGHDGLIEAAGGADDAERLFAYRKFDYYPLVAVSAIDKSTLLQPWRRRTMQTLALAIAGTLIFLLLARHLSQNISRRKRVERALVALNTDLEQRVNARTAQLAAANTELEAFSYSVSHDLRAPLRHILGFSQLAQEMLAADSAAAAQQYLGRVHRAAHRMDVLIKDLLQLAGVSQGKLRMQHLDISRMAQQTGRMLAESRPARHVNFTVQPGMTARGDAGLILVVLENLLGNAWKFTRNSDDPRVEVMQQGQWFVVRDNGVGFETRAGADPFAPFQRCHSESEFEGSGIGLATVKRIVARHGGNVRATGTPGKGASFGFTLAPTAHSNHSNHSNTSFDTTGQTPSGKSSLPAVPREQAGIRT
jgi:signal transduction histidine kinase